MKKGLTSSAPNDIMIIVNEREVINMTPRELFELIEDLCKKYGKEKVKKTLQSIIEML